MATSLVLLGIAYLGIDYAIEASLRRRWKSAAQPALWQVLEAMIELHGELERQLRTASEPREDGHALTEYAATVDRHAPLMTATPELARIYSLVASHLGDAQELVRIHRQRSVPSWDPVHQLNDAASAATTAIASYLRVPIPAPQAVRAEIETLADVFPRSEVRRDDGPEPRERPS